jgi:hypothetical protein
MNFKLQRDTHGKMEVQVRALFPSEVDGGEYCNFKTALPAGIRSPLTLEQEADWSPGPK